MAHAESARLRRLAEVDLPAEVEREKILGRRGMAQEARTLGPSASPQPHLTYWRGTLDTFTEPSPQAEAERDAMRVQLAQRGKEADAALAEAAGAQARVHAERESIHRSAQQQARETEAARERTEAQLAEALETSARLQELFGSQQRLAESYREAAREAIQRLNELSVRAEAERGVTQLPPQAAASVEAGA